MKKNNLIFSLITLLVFFVASCGSGTENNSSNNGEKNDENTETTTDENKTPKETTQDDKINYIKEKFSEIEKNLSSYKTKKAKFEGAEGTEGSEYYVYKEWLAYYNGDKIVKLIASSGDEGYWGDVSYYYDNGKLFFVFQQVEYDGKPIEENRIYIYDGKIIDALTKTVDEMSDKTLSEVKNKKYEEVLTGELKDMYFNWEQDAMDGFLENVEN